MTIAFADDKEGAERGDEAVGDLQTREMGGIEDCVLRAPGMPATMASPVPRVRCGNVGPRPQ